MHINTKNRRVHNYVLYKNHRVKVYNDIMKSVNGPSKNCSSDTEGV